ncbi:MULTISPECIES: hypothetical protein [Thiorhodovibrio]|uniref:hypothetical protein n=1 Tax=Thiorhodovibrio TaxID=61593 RepID=UPI0019116495|nr:MULTISPECIES: hypothetical protein [Thiorhodovibrio]MBK5967987.1 hypothetical protein [Thiorhodovibrio winogradskyi]WPL11803.1 hypothetical protein Thiosp_01555 [Thiorhodovibrio litoralis]
MESKSNTIASVLTCAALIFSLSPAMVFAMGSEPDPNAPPPPCTGGQATQASGWISKCQWAAINTGLHSVRLRINPDEKNGRYLKGEILDAHFSTRVSLCDGQSDGKCRGQPKDLIGRIVGNGETFQFQAGPDIVMEGKIKAYDIDGVTHFGFASCTCR